VGFSPFWSIALVSCCDYHLRRCEAEREDQTSEVETEPQPQPQEGV